MEGKRKRGIPPKAKHTNEFANCENDNTVSTESVERHKELAKAGLLARQAKALARHKGGDNGKISKLDDIIDKITMLLDNKVKLSVASVSQLGILLGICVDKKRLLEGKSTSIQGVVNVIEAGDRTIGALDRLSQAIKGTSPKRLETTEVVDCEVIPVK